MYTRVHEWNEEECEKIWNEWLWGCDCNGLPSEKCCDMNRMHGMGILCCIGESVRPAPMYEESFASILPETPSVHLHGNKAISQFTLRELMDQIECMQLNWGQILSDMRDEGTCSQGLIRAIMARVGFLAKNAFPTAKAEDGYEGFVLDDPQHTCMMPQSQGAWSIISRKTLRQVVCVLLGLARAQDIVQRVVLVEEQSEEVLNENVLDALKQHHIEASMEFFNSLQQMMQLAPGMRLVYRTNFSGMYNDVSQVIYFHFPKFCRQPQMALVDIGGHTTMNLFPLIRELLPDIPVCYDDDSKIPGLTTASGANDEKEEAYYIWLISCGTVFLVEVATGRVYGGGDNLTDLVYFLLKTTKRTVLAQEEDRDEESKRRKRLMAECFTEHGHVLMALSSQ